MKRTAYQRERLRFEDVEHDTFPDGRCRVRVRFEWHGERISAESAGTETREGILRAAARATLDVARIATRDRVRMELTGIKAVRAFDAWVIIAAVRAHTPDGTLSLLGSLATADDDPARGAVLAVLDATNRALERHLSEREA